MSRQNKCGPGQPPGPHWFRGWSCCPSPRMRHGGAHPSRAHRRARVTMPLRGPSVRSVLRGAIRSTTVAEGPSCRVWRTLGGGRNARATIARRNAFWRNPPGNSPSRITRNRRLCPQCPGRANRTSRLDVSHCARSHAPHQEKSRAALCRNCARQYFLVESHGKTGCDIPRRGLRTQCKDLVFRFLFA
jgi:hypothetical protein